MSKVRWGLGIALAGVALCAAVQALGTYAGRGLWLGALSVVMLLVMDVAGMGILWRARMRLAREWTALNADIPGGELLTQRRKRLQAIHDGGGVPHSDVLADAAATAEHGNAYLGRYMVAVTVLVGLVGTFAGLMETLRHVAPMLTDEKASAMAVIAAPLAGLDVTFGASVVGILVTLALSLVQGDLLLAEDAVLARLEDLSAHVLVPTLWPVGQSATVRAADEMAGLRGDMAVLLEKMAQASAERVSKVADAALARQATLLERVATDVLTSTAKANAHAQQVLETAGNKVLEGLAAASGSMVDGQKQWQAALAALVKESAQRMEEGTAQIPVTVKAAVDALVKATQQTQQGVEVAGTRVLEGLLEGQRARKDDNAQWRDALAALVKESSQRMEEGAAQIPVAVKAAVEALLAATHQTQQAVDATAQRMLVTTEETRTLLHQGVETLVKTQRQMGEDNARTVETLVSHTEQAGVAVDQALSRVLEHHADELRHAASAITTAVGVSFGEATTRLDAAAALLAQAASQLKDGTLALAPSVESLAPELGALSREIALMAARSDENGADNLVLEELARVGDGVNQLQALMKMARS